jgi:hypothetical protein
VNTRAASRFASVFTHRYILGWVTNWRAIELFLYRWWPITPRRRLRQRLAAASVELIALCGQAIDTGQLAVVRTGRTWDS